jgi:hypothetical protein
MVILKEFFKFFYHFFYFLKTEKAIRGGGDKIWPTLIAGAPLYCIGGKCRPYFGHAQTCTRLIPGAPKNFSASGILVSPTLQYLGAPV